MEGAGRLRLGGYTGQGLVLCLWGPSAPCQHLLVGMLRRWDDSQKYLSDNVHLVCEETANYLVIWCIDLEVEEVSGVYPGTRGKPCPEATTW